MIYLPGKYHIPPIGKRLSCFKHALVGDIGQIIATSAEVSPNGGLVRESPPKSPKHSGLGIIGKFA